MQKDRAVVNPECEKSDELLIVKVKGQEKKWNEPAGRPAVRMKLAI